MFLAICQIRGSEIFWSKKFFAYIMHFWPVKKSTKFRARRGPGPLRAHRKRFKTQFWLSRMSLSLEISCTFLYKYDETFFITKFSSSKVTCMPYWSIQGPFSVDWKPIVMQTQSTYKSSPETDGDTLNLTLAQSRGQISWWTLWKIWANCYFALKLITVYAKK